MSKKALHVVYSLGPKSREELEPLKRLLGKKLSAEDIEQARLLIRDSGGLETVKGMSKAHAEKAKALIAGTGLDQGTKKVFSSFINYIEQSLDWYRQKLGDSGMLHSHSE